MIQVALKTVKRGQFFRRKENSKKTYTREGYDRSEKKYECHDYEDISGFIYLKGETKVWIGFDY